MWEYSQHEGTKNEINSILLVMLQEERNQKRGASGNKEDGIT
jgi:hypothetical protein